MTLYPPTLMEAVTGDTQITYHAQDYRLLVAALAPHNGTILAGDLLPAQRAAGANLSVDVAAGQALISGTSIANQGTYAVRSDTTVNVPIAAPDTSNPRIDIIVATVHDKQADGGSSYSWTITAVAGVPGASPAVPSTPASSLKLAEVYVPQNATSILNTGTNASGGTGSITDKRVLTGTGDVPKWDFFGTPGTPQAVPNATDTNYTPSGTFQQVGVSTAGMRSGEVQILTPGRYVVHFSCRLLPSGASCLRSTFIDVFSADGTTRQRRIGQDLESTNNRVITAAGTLYLYAGQRINARIYQNSGGNLSVDNTYLELDFTGVWIGS